MNKPNFFIIGAPKCGTTSLAHWLSQHERIFMTQPKEPHHFDTDHPNRDFPDSAAYFGLFDAVTPGQRAVGEASTNYLASIEAVPNILAAIEDPKFIVSLRDPADMVVSFHNQLFNMLDEDIPDIAEAWAAQPARLAGRRIPRTCREPSRLQYARVGKLAGQLERLFTHVERDRVRIVFLDQIQRNPLAVYKDLLAFLGVPYDGRVDFARLNSAARLRSRGLQRALRGIGLVKQKLGLPRFNSGIMARIAQGNREAGQRNAPADPAFVDAVLRPYFAEEARRLETYRNLALDLGR